MENVLRYYPALFAAMFLSLRTRVESIAKRIGISGLYTVAIIIVIIVAGAIVVYIVVISPGATTTYP